MCLKQKFILLPLAPSNLHTTELHPGVVNSEPPQSLCGLCLCKSCFFSTTLPAYVNRICHPQICLFGIRVILSDSRYISSKNKNREYNPFLKEIYICEGTIRVSVSQCQEEKKMTKSQENLIIRKGSNLNLHNKLYPYFS